MSVKVCKRCLLDTTLRSIRFDAEGICNYCHSHDMLVSYYQQKIRKPNAVDELVLNIKKTGRRLEYDCIVGVSGGVDSSYALYMAKNMGLRPLAVHFDNGWDTDEAVTNIKNMTAKLDVSLYTYVMDWQEFRSLQVAFLKASVPCIETPTDVGIHGALMRVAHREGIRYIIGGQSFFTEGTVPREWGYLDGLYIQSVNKEFGTAPLRSFPNLTIPTILFYMFIKGIRQVPLLNYLDYDKEKAGQELTSKFGWRPYGGNHYESIYSKFVFGWLLPRKFGIDKRKVYLSGPVRSGLISRARAQCILSQSPSIPDDLVEYCIRKLELTAQEFDRILALPVKSYRDYKTSDSFLQSFKGLVKTAVDWDLVTPVLYEKYCN